CSSGSSSPRTPTRSRSSSSRSRARPSDPGRSVVDRPDIRLRAPVQGRGPGAPIAVLLDYDGTISLRDVGDELMRRFVADQAAVEAMDARYVAGSIGSRELMAWDMDM